VDSSEEVRPEAAAGRTEEPPEAPALEENVVRKLQELDGASGGMAEVGDLFIRDSKSNVENLRWSAEANDGATVSTIAHSLKGSAGNFGARRLSDLCEDAEEHMAAGRLSLVLDTVTEIEGEFDRVETALRATFATEPDLRPRERR
jgi:HPt (histidine-containing phosphotransfer) domain-containing protein